MPVALIDHVRTAVLLAIAGWCGASDTGVVAMPPIRERPPASVALALAPAAWSALEAVAGGTCCRAADADGAPALVLDLGRMEDATRVWAELPPGQRGDAWQAAGWDCLVFAARARGGVAAMALYAIAGRGTAIDTALSCPFAVAGGEWRQVVIPLAWLGAKRLAAVHGLGLCRQAGPEGIAAAGLEIRDLRLARSAYAEADLLRPARISLLGAWRTAPESDARAQAAADCDDSAWATVLPGKPPEEPSPGWSWYRQTMAIPAAAARAGLVLELAKFAFDDEVYLNGQPVGGTAGLYRFAEYDQRCYALPPAAVRCGESNHLAIRLWSGDGLRQGRSESGLVAGAWSLRIQPAALWARSAADPAPVPVERFDISRAQQGLAFDLVLRLPEGVAIDPAADLRFDLVDATRRIVHTGQARLEADGGPALIAPVPEDAARELYLRGRYTARFTAVRSGEVLACLALPVERPCYAGRDRLVLPALAEESRATPYGHLRLVDEIDAAAPIARDPHPYMQGRFSAGKGATPGGAVAVHVRDILGQRARVADEPGWFAWRVGRGGLRAGATYLLRVAYPEDVPRYAAVQIQAGRNQVGVGWRNGVAPGDPYDGFPLSGTWRWFDTIVVAGERTAGHQGAYSADGAAGFWVYFLDQVDPGRRFPMYAGGPAVGRIQLYEIDAARDAPRIVRPEGLPGRTLLFDWEREPDQDVDGVCRYARLMGYSAVAPTILKWGTGLWAEPMPGYEADQVDRRGYAMAKRAADPAAAPATVAPGLPTAHAEYLRRAAEQGLAYLPRIEYGGSALLPESAWAIDPRGGFAKPNRFASWSANLLDEATYADFKALLDHLIAPHADGVAGILWRVRCERMQISYGGEDLRRFFAATHREPPPGSRAELARLVAGGDLADAYRAWWAGERARFLGRIRDLLRSYRPGLDLWYYNWDIDKWGLGIYDQTTARYAADVAQAGEGNALQVYRRNLALIAGWSGDDFVRMVRTGTVNPYLAGRADQAMDMEPYRELAGIRVFCPTDYVYASDSPAYLRYFRTGSGVAVSNTISYDECSYKRLHPNYECAMVLGGGGGFSMANEVLAWFHADARDLTYTAYTFARGFADAHRHFAQAFLALPAVPGSELPADDPDVRIRSYADGAYVGVANRAATARTVTVRVPGTWTAPPAVTDLVAGTAVPSRLDGGAVVFTVAAGAMELDAFRIR